MEGRAWVPGSKLFFVALPGYPSRDQAASPADDGKPTNLEVNDSLPYLAGLGKHRNGKRAMWVWRRCRALLFHLEAARIRRD